MNKFICGVAVALCALQADAQGNGTERKVQICEMWSGTTVDPAKLRVAGALDQHERPVDSSTHSPPHHRHARAQFHEQTIYLPEQAWELTVAHCMDRLDDLAREPGSTQ